MTGATLNLDKLAAQQAQEMVRKVREEAEREAEDRGRQAGKSPEEIERDKQVLREKRTETLERLATKTLGVLQEQGVYAMMLFLFSRTSDEAKVAECCIRPQLYQVLKALPAFQNDADVPDDEADAETALKFYTEKILDDLDTLLLVRDLYEQTLIYTRYGAKAAAGGEP